MTACNCVAFALHTSEQLNRIESSLTSCSPDQILTTARQASLVCQQYALCPHCSVSASFVLFPALLSKSVALYDHLLRLPSQSSSPAAASTSSASSGWYGATTRLRIGAFEVEAGLDESTRAAILRAQVRRVAETATLLVAVVSPSGLKGGRNSLDESTVEYQRSLVTGVRDEIAALDQRLQDM
jgi:ABC-type Fe3+/spermidine/putrescine transport system ATPase subunit